MKQHKISLGLIVFILGLLIMVRPLSIAQAQSGQEVGAAPGLSAFEFVGQIDQNALDITAYGYLTHINGLPDDQLFTVPIPLMRSESTARFTFKATGKLSGRYSVQNLIDTDTELAMTIYFNPNAGGSFAKPDSFAAGTAIATLTVHYQQILVVGTPDTGTVIGTGESTQGTSNPFTLNNQQYQLGHAGLVERFSSYGSGKRTEPTAPKSQFVIGGNATAIAGLSK